MRLPKLQLKYEIRTTVAKIINYNEGHFIASKTVAKTSGKNNSKK